MPHATSTSTPTFTPLTDTDTHCLLPGTIVWLPPRSDIRKGTYKDPQLMEGAFNHPAIILACPSPKELKVTGVKSIVRIAIITSFHNSSIKSHLSTKGQVHRTGTLAAQKAGYLRIVTASKPCAKDVLKLRGGMGMKRDSAYVNVKEGFRIAVGGLGRYGGRGEGVCAYRLTVHAMKALLEGVEEYQERKKKKQNRLKPVTATSRIQ